MHTNIIKNKQIIYALAALMLATSVFSVCFFTARAMALSGVIKPVVKPVATKYTAEKPGVSVTKGMTNGAVQSAEVKKKTEAAASAAKSANGAGSQAATVSVPASAPKPIVGFSLYVDPTLKQRGRPAAIADRPSAVWFGGWNANVQGDIDALVSRAASTGGVATAVAYNIPGRDCGQYSSGGANDSENYRAWIRAFAAGIGARKTIVILEPDALAGLDCLPANGQSQRMADIAYAVNVFRTTGAVTYVDAGNYSWQSAGTMAQRLKQSGVAGAQGFSLNVSGYGWTNQSVAYGQQLSAAVGGKSFVIDTSRNGTGPAQGNEWCNPRGRGLGKAPSTATGVRALDAYLWVKVPGESDGTCNGGPSAGTWWDDIANELIQNARL